MRCKFGLVALIGFFSLVSCIASRPVNYPAGNYEVVIPSRDSGPTEVSYAVPLFADNNQAVPGKGKIALSLDTCIKAALENNRQLLSAMEGKNKAKGRLKETEALRYPQLTVNLTYTRIDEINTFDIGPTTIETGSLDNYKGEASLKQLLYQGGKIRALIYSAELGQRIAALQFDDTKEAIYFLVAKSYYDVVLNQEILDVNKKSLETTSAHRDNVKALKGQGMVSDYELLRAEVQVSNLKTLVMQAESNLKLSKLTLLRVMGAPTDDESAEIELIDKFDYIAQTTDLQKSMETAFNLRPDLAQAGLLVKMQKESIKAARADLRPTVSVFANGGEEKPSRKVFGGTEWGDYWNAGGMVSFPLFEGGKTRGKIMQEKAVLHQYQLALSDTEEKVRYEVKQAFLTLKDAEEMINAQKENVKQAREGLRLAELGYKNGVNTQLEVMDAQTALDIAQKNYLSSLYGYNVAYLMLKKSMGVLNSK
ncbi:MAG: TolC family protein [Planctomycetes bacterium]|nr:TolC family protein [Planctomycetota bacterium]